MGQEVCPFNIEFAHASKEPQFVPREFLVAKDAHTLAREILVMSQEEFSTTFGGALNEAGESPGFKAPAAVVLGNIGARDHVDT